VSFCPENHGLWAAVKLLFNGVCKSKNHLTGVFDVSRAKRNKLIVGARQYLLALNIQELMVKTNIGGMNGN
jgi:hypothetical protein